MPHPITTQVQQILTCPADALSANKATVDALVQQLCAITDIELHPDLFLDENATLTAQGKAVSMTTAAQCAEEYMRTQVFLRGVHAAINDQLAQRETVEILYAGTGPFGLLLLPLLPRFDEGQLKVTLLDIHPESLAAVGQCIQALDVSHHIQQIHCTDILQWQPEPGTRYDLIISETMKAMLVQEPQLAIFTHLSPFLAKTGELIPQQIQIDSWLTTGTADAQPPVHIGQLFTLDNPTALALNQQPRKQITLTQPLPPSPDTLTTLEFTTHIQVYQQHQLGRNQCSLNLPQVIHNARPIPGSSLISCYIMGPHPRFEFDYQSQPGPADLPLVDMHDDSVLGVPHLKRFWHKIQLEKQKKLDHTLRQQEWALDMQLCSLLQLELAPTLQTLFASETPEALEAYVLACNRGSITTRQRQAVAEQVTAYQQASSQR